jgi:exodeoxyribonuclease VII large subunit
MATRHYLKQQQERYQYNAQALHVVSPLATLGRGYAIVRDEQNQIVRDASQLGEGSAITARLGRGSVSAKVTEINSSGD